MDSYDFPFAYRNLAMNAHRSSAGALVAANEADTIRVDRFDFSRLQQRDQREAYHLLSGGDLGDATLAFRYLSLSGTVKASSGALLDDAVAKILNAFDVEEAQASFPATEGVSAFTFTGVTTIATGRGTAFTDPRGNAGEFVPEQFLARPAAYPIITGRRSGGDAVGYAVELVCGDRRRYIQTAESAVANAGNGFVVALPNWSTTTGIAVPPLITIVLTGAGSATFTVNITNDLVNNLILDLSAETAGTFTWDTATGIIKKATTHRADLRTSPVTTLYPYIRPGGATMTVTNTTNVTSVTAAYSQARG